MSFIDIKYIVNYYRLMMPKLILSRALYWSKFNLVVYLEMTEEGNGLETISLFLLLLHILHLQFSHKWWIPRPSLQFQLISPLLCYFNFSIIHLILRLKMVCDPADKGLKSILTKKFRFGIPNPRQLHVQGSSSSTTGISSPSCVKCNLTSVTFHSVHSWFTQDSHRISVHFYV
jgi:hypothetical protein